MLRSALYCSALSIALLSAPLAVLHAALPTAALAEPLKVVTVDMNRLLNETKEAQAKKKELDTLSMAAKKKLDARRSSLKALEQKLQAAKATEDSPEAESFKSQARDFARMVKDSEDDIKAQFVKVNKTLLESANQAIKKYAETNHIDLILDKSEKLRGPVLFGDSSADITDALLKELGK